MISSKHVSYGETLARKFIDTCIRAILCYRTSHPPKVSHRVLYEKSMASGALPSNMLFFPITQMKVPKCCQNSQVVCILICNKLVSKHMESCKRCQLCQLPDPSTLFTRHLSNLVFVNFMNLLQHSLNSPFSFQNDNQSNVNRDVKDVRYCTVAPVNSDSYPSQGPLVLSISIIISHPHL